jgi:hypothetical protein
VFVIETHLVARDRFTGAIEDEESRRSGPLINAAYKPLFIVLSARLGDSPGEMLLVLSGHVHAEVSLRRGCALLFA